MWPLPAGCAGMKEMKLDWLLSIPYGNTFLNARAENMIYAVANTVAVAVAGSIAETNRRANINFVSLHHFIAAFRQTQGCNSN